MHDGGVIACQVKRTRALPNRGGGRDSWLLRREKRSLRDQITTAEIVLIAWMLIAGWWYARNVNLYGDPTGTNRMIEIAGAREDFPTVREWIEGIQPVEDVVLGRVWSV